MREIVYDLTEVFYGSRGKLKYYGIVRVVADIAAELLKHAPGTRYCIYSPAHEDFLEVFPTLDDSVEGGVAMNVPVAACPARIREIYHDRHALRDMLVKGVLQVAKMINRKRWREAGVDLPKINLDGKALVMTGRPKLMLSPLKRIEEKGWDVRVHALLHDMIPLHDAKGLRSKAFPRNFLNDNRFVIERSAQIIANSHFTEDDIRAFADEGVLPPLPPTTTVQLCHECRPGTEAPEKVLPDEPYLLAVGALIGRKNLEIVFNAMLVLHERGLPVPHVVLAGAVREHVTKYLQQEKYAPIRDKVEQSANPNQTDLIRYYEGALGLVLASWIEGWGLPAGEALWLGTPALCSTAPVLHEVCGDLGLYFEADKPEQLADHVDRLMNVPGYRDALVERIKTAKPTLRSWADVARDAEAAVRQLD
ncbi:glycosyltransferase [Chachezhania sediminis]|uniref:glycosyltransferase n=1 Tax=Chachezhania sediminis TaxID=2599291 RepID=UPI00131BDD47|nr:glycosyltransferase [Chachezhania sediminis]